MNLLKCGRIYHSVTCLDYINAIIKSFFFNKPTEIKTGTKQKNPILGDRN